MQAIAEMIAALVECFVHLLIALVELVAALVAMAIEFLLLAITKGVPAASGRFKQRRQALAQRRESRANLSPGDAPASTAAPVDRRTILISIAVIALVVAGFAVGAVVRDRIRQRRIEATRLQITRLADELIRQVKDEKAADPAPGLLADRDAWNQPVELFVDEMLLGTMLVVRSHGPDRQSGTIDDLLEIRVARAPAAKVGGELVNRGVKALRDRAARLRAGDDDEPAEDLQLDQPEQ